MPLVPSPSLMLGESALLANHLVNLFKWKKISLAMAKLRIAHDCKVAEPLQQG